MPGAKVGLFNRTSLRDEAQSRTDEALRAVNAADINDLLGRDIDVLVDEMMTPFGRATVRWDDVTMTEPTPATAITTDVFGREVQLAQASSTFTVPVDGDSLLLTYRSDSGAPAFGGLEGTARNGALEFLWIGDLGATPDSLREWFNRHRDSVVRFLVNNNNT